MPSPSLVFGQRADQVRQHLDVVLVDLRQLGDPPRILAVMRHAVEARRRRFALRVGAAGQVAGEEQRADAGDVGLERQRQQVELQLDVLVEGLRHADRHLHVLGRDGRGLHRNLQPPLDLADVLGVVVEPGAVGRADVAAQPREAAGQRVEDALVALAPRRPLLDRAAVAEHPLEHHLRVQLHRQRRVGDAQEIVLV